MKHQHLCIVHNALYECEHLGCTKPQTALCDRCILDYPTLSLEELQDLSRRAGHLIENTSDAILFLKQEREQLLKEGGGEPRAVLQQERVVMPEQLDLMGARSVDITIRADGKTVWVNVDGVCRFRVCRIEQLALYDQREQKSKRAEAGKK